MSTRIEDRVDRLEALVVRVIDSRIASAEAAAATNSAALSEQVTAIQAALALLLENSCCCRSVVTQQDTVPKVDQPEAEAKPLLSCPAKVQEEELAYSCTGCDTIFREVP